MRHRNMGLGWLALGALLVAGCGQGQSGPTAPPPLPVAVATVTQQDVPVYAEWIASTDGAVNATIRAQVQGYLVSQRYREGDLVEKGQLLFEIDARPFQATLSHAEAAEQQAVAALSQAEATLEQSKADVAKQEALWINAKANYDRFKELVGRGAVAQKDVDDATGAERATAAAVAAAKANVTAAQAAIGVQAGHVPVDHVDAVHLLAPVVMQDLVIAVDDAAVVGFLQDLADLDRHLDQLGHRQEHTAVQPRVAHAQ